MKVKVRRTDPKNLEIALNEIGYENVLQILNEKCYDGEFYNIIYSDITTTPYDGTQTQPYKVTPWQPYNPNIPVTPWPNE